MLNKIIFTLVILVSPFISLVALTPISIFPAIFIARLVTKTQCDDIQSESLCGFGNSIFYVFIINIILGFLGVMTIMLVINDKWTSKRKVLNVLGLLVYFTVAAALSFYNFFT